MSKNMRKWDKQEVMDRLCDEIACSSVGMQKILDADKENYPSRKTINKWLNEKDESGNYVWGDQYARAKEDQMEFLGDEIIHISDNEVGSPVIIDGVPLIMDGKIVKTIDSAAVQHAKLRTENRRWLMGKLKPKKYGEKIQQEITAPEGVSFNMNFGGKSE